MGFADGKDLPERARNLSGGLVVYGEMRTPDHGARWLGGILGRPHQPLDEAFDLTLAEERRAIRILETLTTLRLSPDLFAAHDTPRKLLRYLLGRMLAAGAPATSKVKTVEDDSAQGAAVIDLARWLENR